MAFALLLLAMPALAQELPPESPIAPRPYHVQQGGIVVIPLDPTQCYGRTLEAMGRTWRCESDGRLLMGASYNEACGHYELTAKTAEESSRVLATVVVGPSEFDRDEKQKKARPPAKANKRIDEEAVIDTALSVGERKYPSLTVQSSWQPPLAVMKHSGDTYGMYRDNVVYRGTGKKRRVVDSWTTRHRGVDLRARVGTAVFAPSAGVVVHAKLTSLEGKMIVIYHGSSVYSLHMHLSRISVHEGQHVETGQHLGSTGDTGARGQPHLHYATKVGGVYVDPEAFIETINREW